MATKRKVPEGTPPVPDDAPERTDSDAPPSPNTKVPTDDGDEEE